MAQGDEELTRLRRWAQWFPPLVLVFVFAGCGVYFWEAPGRDVTAFQSDSGACIKEATIKYNVASERIYRACMKARGWQRAQVMSPSDQQFRGPEGDDELTKPPDPLSDRSRSTSDAIR